MALQHLRASTANKRPTPAAMADGQLAVNTAAVSPGLFFKDAAGALIKVGPVHVGTTAPNATPASGGQAGNSIGEQWLDTSNSRFVFKVWDGTAWRTEDGEFVNASGATMTGALVMDNQQQIRFRETTANGTNFIALQAPASVASDKTITLPDVTGTVVTTGDTGSVTSTMILDGTIVNADVNASAAIADTKLATIATAGKVSNSATTAASANTASAIVARDASGNFSAGTITANLTGTASTVTTNANLTGDITSVGNATAIAAGVIVDADINATAAIAPTKINGTAVVDNDARLTNTRIPTDGSITDAKVAANAEIAVNKLADGSARQLLQTDAAGTGVEWTSNVDVPGTLDVTGAAVFDSTVAVTGALTKGGSNVVTVGDTGTVSTAMVANDAVTYAKLQNVSATDRLLGRSAAGAGDVEEITCTAAGRALLDDADAAAQRTTLGLGTLATQSGTFSGTSSGTNTGDQTITLTGDVTGSGTGSFATAIAAGVIDNADVNASAAIAGTKISPDFGSQTVTTTGVISSALGAAATPSITFTGDLNTGIYSPGADQVAISTNGTGRLFVDASGRILSGLSSTSTSCSAIFQGNATSSTGAALFFLSRGSVPAGSGENLGIIRFTDNAQNTGALIQCPPEAAWSPGSSHPAALLFGTTPAGSTAALERLRITSAGLVGLGTSSPSALLEVNGTPNATIQPSNGIFKVNSTGGNGLYVGNIGDSTYASYIQSAFITANSPNVNYPLLLNPNGGNVGIGTTSPGYSLQVNGSTSIIAVQNNGSNNTRALIEATDSAVYFGSTYSTNDIPMIFSRGGTASGTERMRIDTSGRLLIGTSTATGPAILQVQTPTTLSTTLDAGTIIANTSTKTYPTAASFNVTAGLSQNIELGTAQTIDTVTPGGFNFVAGTNIALTKSAGNTQDIERLFFSGFNHSFVWTDANTCKQYTGITDIFNYQGINANGRTSSSLTAQNLTLAVPNGGTQTIANTTGSAATSLQVTNATGTINVTTGVGVVPSLAFRAITSGTLTANITNYTFLGTSTSWGASVIGTGVNVATITNLYGLRLTAPASSTGLTVTNNWGIRQEWSSAKNWFAGASNQFPNITTTASGANAFLDSADSNQLYRSTSSLTYKRDVEDLDSSIADQVLNLRPVWYRSKCETDCADWSWYGLIAEEVAEIDPRFVHYGYQEDAYELIETTETAELPPDDPRREEGIDTEEITRQERQLKADAQQVPNGVAYERLVVPLLDIIKRQKSQLESFEARLAALEAQ